MIDATRQALHDQRSRLQGALARELGGIYRRCDVGDKADVDDVVAHALSVHGRIDVLVNVAGGSGPIGKTGWETTEEEFDEIVDLNMRGCFNTMRACLPSMIAQQGGKIVNVGGSDAPWVA